jgi:4-hydroxy-3-methylbut-2-en-1-yl diphosphate reductase
VKVIIDPTAGPCGGVKRAIRMVENRLRKDENIVAIGPLIHNNAEVQRLAEQGLETVQQDKVEQGDFSAAKGKQIFIRSHGISESLRQDLEKAGAELVDATCPKVTAIQNKIQEQHDAGRQIVIVGKVGHPEVKGLDGYCENKAVIISSEDDLAKIDASRPTFLVSQTTISHRKFIDLKEKIVQIVPDVLVKDTICRQVMNKHKDLRNFAASVDVLLLVGGKHSSNTSVLFELAKSVNSSSHWIEGEDDIKLDWIDHSQTVGVSGSASTPMWQLDKIQDFLKKAL